jgi:hypothetical protein
VAVAGRYNHRVFGRLCRAIVALSLAPALVLAAAQPQDHVHEADLDHSQSVVHHHAEVHQLASDGHDEADIDHNEKRTVWLSNVSLHRAPYHLAVSWTVADHAFTIDPRSATWVAAVSYNASPPHGPPGPCRSPRAPPFVPA